MDATVARAAAVEQIDAEGYVVLEDVLPPAMVDELLGASSDLYEASSKTVGVEPLHSLTAFEDDPRIRELLTLPLVLEVVQAALGENVLVYHSHLDVQPQYGHRDYHWHQDIDLITCDCGRLAAPLCLKVGFFFSDAASPAHGATRVQPRTHSDVPFDPASDGIPVEVRAGSAVILDHRLWHTRGLNTRGVPRAVFWVAYAYRWIRRRDELDDLPDGADGLAAAVGRLLDVLPPEGSRVVGGR